jgi:hypothetical protein
MKLLGLKAPRVPQAAPPPTRDDAADLAARQDELRRRRGSAADIVTGPAGAEAAKGAATLLG